MYKNYKNLCDLHTHTTFSGHGMSSPSEMVDAAIRKGLECIAITDHYYPQLSDLDKKNQDARIFTEIDRSFSYVYDQICVVSGAECNLFADDCFIQNYDRFNPDHTNERNNRFLLIGLHNWYVPNIEGITGVEVLEEFAKRIHSGAYNCVAHPSRALNRIRQVKKDQIGGNLICTILDIMHGERMPLELNETDCSRDIDICLTKTGRYFSMLDMILYAKKIGMDIIINTDAHVHYAVGKIDNALKLLESCSYPADKIINFDRDKIKELIRCR